MATNNCRQSEAGVHTFLFSALHPQLEHFHSRNVGHSDKSFHEASFTRNSELFFESQQELIVITQNTSHPGFIASSSSLLEYLIQNDDFGEKKWFNLLSRRFILRMSWSLPTRMHKTEATWLMHKKSKPRALISIFLFLVRLLFLATWVSYFSYVWQCLAGDCDVQTELSFFILRSNHVLRGKEFCMQPISFKLFVLWDCP